MNSLFACTRVSSCL